MPKTNDTEKRIVELRFENKQFTDAAKETMKALDDLDKSLKNTGTNANAFDHLSNSLSNLNLGSLSRLSENVDSIGKHFTWFGRTVDRYSDQITDSIANMARSGISSLTSLYNKYFGFDPNLAGFDEYEKKMGSIQTILTNTASKGTTLEDVTEALDELNHYADKTIYNFQEMTRNIGTFTAAGIDLADATAAIKGISNLAAGVGSTPQQAANAMYQLSQALAAGTVTLQDWNSVVNAGMGGEYFQNALKETARQIAEAKGIAYETFEGTFRESISGKDGTGWLTSEVLLETLKKFAEDPALEEAATRVKTWSQLIDTMGESVQSGWAQSWEYVIGDLDEASDFFTAISKGFDSIVGSSAEARNEILKFWHDNGGRDQAIKTLKNAFEALYRIFKPIKTAWENVFPPVGKQRILGLTEQILNFSSKLLISETSMERIANVTHIVAVAIKGLLSVVKFAAKGISTILTPTLNLAGTFFGKLIDAASGFVYWLERFIGPITETEKAMTGVAEGATILERALAFGQFILQRLVQGFIDAGKGIGEFARQLGLGKFVDYFEAMADGAKHFINNITLGDVIANFKIAQDKIVEFFASIYERFPILGRFFSFLHSFVPSFKDISKGIESAGGPLKYLGEVFGEFRDAAMERIRWVWGALFGDEVETTTIRLNFNAERIGEILGRIRDFFVEFLTNTGPTLTKIAEFFKPFVDILVKGLLKIREDLGDLDFNDLVNALLLIRGWFMMESVTSLFDSFGAVMEEVGFAIHGISDAIEGFVESATGIFDGLGDALKGFRNDANANALLKIALAIAVLAGSVFLLSKVKFDKGMEALFTFGALVAIMLSSMLVLSKLTNENGEMTFDAKPFLLMAASIMLIAKAMKDMTELASYDEHAFSLAAGYIATGVILLGGIQLILTKWGGKNPGLGVRVALGMIIMVKAVEGLIQNLVTLATLARAGVDLKSGIEYLIGIMVGLGTFFLLAQNIGGFGIRAALGIVILSKCLGEIFNAFANFEIMELGEFMAKMAETTIMLGAIGAFIALVTKFGNAKGILAIGTSFIMLGSAMWIIAEALNAVARSGMKAKEVKTVVNSIGALIGWFTVFGAVTNLTGGASEVGASFIVIAAGLFVLVKALNGLSKVDMDTMGKAALALVAVLGTSALLGNIPSLTTGFEKLAGVMKTAGVGVLAFAAGLTLLSGLLLFAAPLFVLLAAQMGTIVDAIVIIGKGVINVIVELSGPIAEAIMILIYEVLYYINQYIVPISNEISLLVYNILSRVLPSVLDAIADGFSIILIWIGQKLWGLVSGIDGFLADILERFGIAKPISKWLREQEAEAKYYATSDLISRMIDERSEEYAIQHKLDRVEMDTNKALGSWNLNEGATDAESNIISTIGDLTSAISFSGIKAVNEAKELTDELSEELTAADAIIAFNEETNALELKQNDIYGPLPPKRMAGRAEAYETLKKKLEEYNYVLKENQETGAIELVKDVGTLNSALGVADNSLSGVSSTYTELLNLFSGTGNGLVPITFDMSNPMESLSTLSEQYGISTRDLLGSATEDGSTLGSNLIGGILEAYANEDGSVSEAGTKLISGLLSSMNEAAEVHSPSDKTYETARMMILGIVNGFKDGEASIFWSAYNTANEGIIGTRNAFDELSTIFDESFDYNPTISPILDVTGVQEGIWWLKSQFGPSPIMTVTGDIRAETPLDGAVEVMDLRQSDASSVVAELQAMRNDILLLGDDIAAMKIYLNDDTLVGSVSGRLDEKLGEANRRSIRSGRR